MLNKKITSLGNQTICNPISGQLVIDPAEWQTGITILQSNDIAKYPRLLSIMPFITTIREKPLEAIHYWGKKSRFEVNKSLLIHLFNSIQELPNMPERDNRIAVEKGIIEFLVLMFNDPSNDFRPIEQEKYNTEEWTQASHLSIAILNLIQLLTLSANAENLIELKTAYELTVGRLLSEKSFRAPCVNNAIAKLLTLYYILMPNTITAYIRLRIDRISKATLTGESVRLSPDEEFLRRLLINAYKIRTSFGDNLTLLSSGEEAHWHHIYEERLESPPSIDFYSPLAMSIVNKIYGFE